MKRIEENREINEDLKVESSEREKTESESQLYLQKVEFIKRKQQQVEETTVEKEHHNSENIINKGMESKMTCDKIRYNIWV